MIKSKNFTVGVILFVFLYEIFATFTSFKTHNLFFPVINPAFWIVLSICLGGMVKDLYAKNKFKKDILLYSLIAVLIYIILYLFIGLFVGFGKNPYATTLSGIIYNMFTFGVVIIAKEYLRYKLIHNVYEKDKVKIAIFISIVYVIIDFNFYNFFMNSYSAIYIYKEISQRLIPCIAKNILFSYIAMNSDYKPSILYELTIKLYFLTSPILTKTPWILNSIIDILIPFMLYLYLRYMIYKKEVFKLKNGVVEFNPKQIAIIIILVLFASFFTIGLFPIKPISVLTASMYPTISIGDAVIIQKCSASKVQAGDVIEYQYEGYSIIHRVLEIKTIDDKIGFVTKGDNNNQPDARIVYEDQLIGKVLFSIKYLGYPAVWMNYLHTTPTEDINERLID